MRTSDLESNPSPIRSRTPDGLASFSPALYYGVHGGQQENHRR